MNGQSIYITGPAMNDRIHNSARAAGFRCK